MFALLTVAMMTPQPEPKKPADPDFPVKVTLTVPGPNGKGEVVTENVPARFNMPKADPLWTIDAGKVPANGRPRFRKSGTITEKDGTVWVIEKVYETSGPTICVCRKKP